MSAHRLLGVCVVAVGALIVLTGLAGAAPTTAGDLDPGFGSGGTVVLTPGNGSGASAAALQLDGKIVLAGTVSNAPPPPPLPPRWLFTESPDFLAVRMAANGTLDRSFGSGGFAQIPIDLGDNNSDSANAVALGPSGTVVLGGYASTAHEFDSVIVRLTSMGALDPSFAGDGIQIVDVGQGDEVYGVAVQQDGKVVAVGQGGSGFTVFRLDTDGSLDPTFGTGGSWTRLSVTRAAATRPGRSPSPATGRSWWQERPTWITRTSPRQRSFAICRLDSQTRHSARTESC